MEISHKIVLKDFYGRNGNEFNVRNVWAASFLNAESNKFNEYIDIQLHHFQLSSSFTHYLILFLFLSLCLAISLSPYIYIYIYIYMQKYNTAFYLY